MESSIGPQQDKVFQSRWWPSEHTYVVCSLLDLQKPSNQLLRILLFIYLFYFYYYFYFLNLPIEFVFSLVGKNYEHLFYFFFRKTCVLLGNVY